MKLTQSEREFILARRAQEEARLSRVAHRVLVLDVAHRFAAWKAEHGAGSSYSTFCDDFGYDARDGEDRPRLYKEVLAVLTFTRSLVK